MLESLNRDTFKNLFVQLQRRRIFRFLLAYVVIAWIIIEVASVIFPALLLPEWTVRLVVVLVALGILPGLVLAWIFDITPQGIERTSDDNEVADEKPKRGDDLQVALPQIDDAVASVAVLPFDNLSGPGNHEFLAEGVATEIHGRLCKLHRVRVAPRRSSFRFSDASASLEEIARTLNVRYVLSGSLVTAGERVNVIAQLDDARQNTQLWSQKYERNLEDVLTLMSDIAEAVVAAFGGERLRSEISRASEQPTDVLDAWSLVQKARAYILDYSSDSLANAEKSLYEAIALDEGYAAARAALGSVLSEKVLNGFSDDAERDSDESLEMIRVALAQSPQDPFVLKMSGMIWTITGDPVGAIRSLKSSVAIAPYDFGAWGYLGWPMVATGKPGDLAELRRILEHILGMAPDHPGAAYWLHHLAAVHACEDELDVARQFAQQSVDKQRGLSWAWLTYANILGRMGEMTEARHAADEASQFNKNMSPVHYVERMRVMTLDHGTLEKRVSGLRAAGLLE